MGIKNLFPFLKQYRKDANLSDFAGKTAAIDASCWIHRALAISVSQSGNRERLASIFRKHLTLVRSAGVIPFIVFDGSPLPAKTNEAEKRQIIKDKALRRANEAADLEERNKFLSQGISISFEDISTCIEICLKENIRYIVSPYEADAQIASLVKHGHASFVITEDSDLLPYGCEEIFVKAKMSGDGDHFVLAEVLDGLKLTFEQFQKLCISAGCDYVDNVRGIGIHRAYALVRENNLLEVLAKKGAPKDYEEHFVKALSVFNHQTIFSIDNMKCVPLNEWNKQVTDELQHFCGKLPDVKFSIDLASGNLNPKSGVKVNSYPLFQQVPVDIDNRNDEHQKDTSRETNTEPNENERLKVTITWVDSMPFLYKIPSFPVISVSLKKVSYIREGKEYEGLIKDEGLLNIMLGHYVCTSSCSITIDDKLFLVLWELSRDLPVTGRSNDDATDELSGPHCLPFKVLGSCYHTSRQVALKEAYEYLYDFNRHVYAKLEAQPENVHDKCAIGVYVMTDEDADFFHVGYIAKELTKYLHPLLGRSELDVSVKCIRFRTTYLKPGYYLTIEITKNSAWPKEVVRASKYVD